MKKNMIYKFLLMLCFLGIFGTVQAEEVNIKIDFARVVQDAGVDKPNKTAACIIVWVDGDEEEKVFCRYELEKANIFFRDDTEVDKILSNNRNKLLTVNATSFPSKINGWLAAIEKDLEVKILPASKSNIAPLFAEFVKQGAQEYSQAALFKHTQPYDLVLPRQTIDVNKLLYRMFALLVHNEVHRAVSEITHKDNVPVVSTIQCVTEKSTIPIPASDANPQIIIRLVPL